MRILVLALALFATIQPAAAQMVLPGAVAPTPAGVAVSPATKGHGRPQAHVRARGQGPRAASVAPEKTVSPTALAGQVFYLNGGKSQVAFELRDKALAVSRLTLAGEQMSNSRQSCQVDVPGAPFATTDLGHVNGVERVQVGVPACPIAFDLLDGAALATGDPATCEFKDADCRVAPGGLWGPPPSALGLDKSKGIEHARAQAELAVRTNFRRLLSTTKDKPTIIDYAREQAGFSSRREEICRDYAGEDKHGFCASRLTEARAAALRAKADIEEAARPARKKAGKRTTG